MNFCELSDVVRRKIPTMFIVVQLLIAFIAYNKCNNSFTTTISMWIYFPILCFSCYMWELGFTLSYYVMKYPYNHDKTVVMMANISSILSLLLFITSSYYFGNGVPFSCVYDHNATIAGLLLCCVCMIIFSFVLYEVYVWGESRSITPVEFTGDYTKKFIINDGSQKDEDRNGESHYGTDIGHNNDEYNSDGEYVNYARKDIPVLTVVED